MQPKLSADPARRRRRTITAATIFLLVTVLSVMNATAGSDGALRTVDIVRISALVFLAIVLALRSTTNFTLLARKPELDDELTRANRANAAVVGFWAMLLLTTGVYVASFFGAISVIEAAPLVLAAGALAAGARFSLLEAKGDTVA